MAAEPPSIQSINRHISRFVLLCRYGGDASNMQDAAAAIVPGLRAIGGFDTESDMDISLHGSRWNASEVDRAERVGTSGRRYVPTFSVEEQTGLVLVRCDGQWARWTPRGAHGLPAMLVVVEASGARTVCRFLDRTPREAVVRARTACQGGHREQLRKVLSGLLSEVA